MTVPDKEVLEYAAKAIDLDLSMAEWHDDGFYWMPLGTKFWNPLTNDGDALRLAVQLGMSVVTKYDLAGSKIVCTLIMQQQPSSLLLIPKQPEDSWIEVIKDDVYASTRRAITVLAALLGEKK